MTDSSTEKLLLYGALGVGAYFLLKPFFEKFSSAGEGLAAGVGGVGSAVGDIAQGAADFVTDNPLTAINEALTDAIRNPPQFPESSPSGSSGRLTGNLWESLFGSSRTGPVSPLSQNTMAVQAHLAFKQPSVIPGVPSASASQLSRLNTGQQSLIISPSNRTASPGKGLALEPISSLMSDLKSSPSNPKVLLVSSSGSKSVSSSSIAPRGVTYRAGSVHYR